MHFEMYTEYVFVKVEKCNENSKFVFNLHLLHAVLASPVYPGRQTHFAE